MVVQNIVMRKLLYLSIPALFFYLNTLEAQQLFTNTNVQSAYKKQTRSSTGKPGKNYWQNSADYKIDVHFNPKDQLLTGREAITYFNNSPDTLNQVIIRLYPDLYKKGVQRERVIAEKDLNEGVQIDEFKIGEEKIVNFADSPKAFHDNTTLIIKPENSILPHSKVELNINWHYQVNTGSPIRTGMVDSTSYFIAYWFPRVSVYDDIDGWDTWSYNGSQEFYNDFGNFDVSITVPKKFVVWATGNRQNARDNFTDLILNRLDAAQKSTEVVHLIDSADYKTGNVLKSDASGVWKFAASNVTDFAFALSDHYLWYASSVLVDSSTGRRTLAEAAFNPVHQDFFDVASQAHQSVDYMSHFYPKYPFPFDHITVFDGTDQMEYPMMVNDNPEEHRKDAVQLTSHEIFHSYFPFLMGINETQYAWMDEGWASIGESVISPKMGEPEDEGIFSKGRYEQISGTDREVPLITNTKLYNESSYRSNSYGKAGSCYYVLQDLLGDKFYFKALHQYMNEWKGKHPVPYDFFYSINSGSGKNLNWFWNKWFFGWDFPDLALKNVAPSADETIVSVENKGGLPLPVYLSIILKSGKKLIQKYTAEAWKTGSQLMTIKIKQPLSAIASIELGNEFIPDKNKIDNFWITLKK